MKGLLLCCFLALCAACSSGSKVAHEEEEVLFQAKVLTAPHGFTMGVEGPGVDEQGNLYAVNFQEEGTIGKITPDGEVSLFVDLPEGSVGNGIRFDKEGNMLVADYKGHNILRVDMDTKAIDVYAHEGGMNQPNDIAIDNKGYIYASDPDWKAGNGKIWRINPDRKVVLLDTLGTANGIEVSPANDRLYVNEAAMGNVWVYDLDAAGEVSNKRLLIKFNDFGMDGMRCDAEGNLYITRFGKGEVVKLSPEGKVLKEIALVGEKPTNVTFGGEDGRTVYVTMQDQGNIEFFRVDVAGREIHWE